MNATSQKSSVVIGLPVLLVGGTEQQTLTMTEILCGVGYSVTVLCYYEYDKRELNNFFHSQDFAKQ